MKKIAILFSLEFTTYKTYTCQVVNILILMFPLSLGIVLLFCKEFPH